MSNQIEKLPVQGEEYHSVTFMDALNSFTFEKPVTNLTFKNPINNVTFEDVSGLLVFENPSSNITINNASKDLKIIGNLSDINFSKLNNNIFVSKNESKKSSGIQVFGTLGGWLQINGIENAICIDGDLINISIGGDVNNPLVIKGELQALQLNCLIDEKTKIIVEKLNTNNIIISSISDVEIDSALENDVGLTIEGGRLRASKEIQFNGVDKCIIKSIKAIKTNSHIENSTFVGTIGTNEVAEEINFLVTNCVFAEKINNIDLKVGARNLIFKKDIEKITIRDALNNPQPNEVAVG